MIDPLATHCGHRRLGMCLGLPASSPASLGCELWTVSPGARAGGHLLIVVTPGSSSAGLGTGQIFCGMSEGMNDYIHQHGEPGTGCSGWSFLLPPALSLPQGSHTSLFCSISSPPLGPEIAASSSSSVSGRTHCLKRWAWANPGQGG